VYDETYYRVNAVVENKVS